MNLYLVWSPPNTDWESAVVAAETEEEVKAFMSDDGDIELGSEGKITLIGTAIDGSISGIVCFERYSTE